MRYLAKSLNFSGEYLKSAYLPWSWSFKGLIAKEKEMFEH
jgi:hypothetical protein